MQYSSDIIICNIKVTFIASSSPVDISIAYITFPNAPCPNNLIGLKKEVNDLLGSSPISRLSIQQYDSLTIDK